MDSLGVTYRSELAVNVLLRPLTIGKEYLLSRSYRCSFFVVCFEDKPMRRMNILKPVAQLYDDRASSRQKTGPSYHNV